MQNTDVDMHISNAYGMLAKKTHQMCTVYPGLLQQTGDVHY